METSVWCVCGEVLVVSLGDEYVMTPEGVQVWMRRQYDAIMCPACGVRYDFEALLEAQKHGQRKLA